MAASACARISSCRRTDRRRTRPSSSFRRRDAFVLRSSRDMSLALGGASSSGADERSSTRSTKGPTSGRRLSEMGSNAERELAIAWSRDLGRAIDYLETRPDIDRARLAFYGVSAGGDAGVILTALEPRLKTSVLQGDRDLARCAARNRRAQLCAAHAHPDADVEWALRLRRAARDGAASAVRPAGISGRAQTARGLRDRSRACRSTMWPREILPWLDRYLGPVVR